MVSVFAVFNLVNILYISVKGFAVVYVTRKNVVSNSPLFIVTALLGNKELAGNSEQFSIFRVDADLLVPVFLGFQFYSKKREFTIVKA